MIEISNLYKYYGDQKAVGPLSATIEKGQIVGLLGLNGAGKTTTLRVLACDLLPTSGTVKVGGIDVVERPDEVRKRIGYLPDTPPLYGEMTVREYLTYCARLHGVPRADLEKRVSEAIELTEVVDQADQIISSLSHGFRQRVGIAQAIVHRPELVVLDEPISGLDPVQIVEMRELVRSLRGEHTVIVSSHILHEISETCDLILVIRDGQIVASGTEAELSKQLLQGGRVDVTVQLASASDSEKARVADVLKGVPEVLEVEPIDAAEPGDGIATFRVVASKEIRPELCRALVQENVALIGLSRSERELESVFLELSRTTGGGAAERRAKRKRSAKSRQESDGTKPTAAAGDA
ncbi:MAG TPA: ABC transporter ATP-binding protein [Polyangiaceae bacterium]